MKIEHRIQNVYIILEPCSEVLSFMLPDVPEGDFLDFTYDTLLHMVSLMIDVVKNTRNQRELLGTKARPRAPTFLIPMERTDGTDERHSLPESRQSLLHPARYESARRLS